MNLTGWPYVGRVLTRDLKIQIYRIVSFLSDSSKVNHRTWGVDLQNSIGKELQVEPGQIRTIKRMMEIFKIIKPNSLVSQEIPDGQSILTKNGRTLVKLFEIEFLAESSGKDIVKISSIIDLLLMDAMLNYTIKVDNNEFHPAFVLLKAFNQYKYLTRTEWYLLNTFVTKENDEEGEKIFSEYLNKLRSGLIEEDSFKITVNTLSHSYILGNFKVAKIVSYDSKTKRYFKNDQYSKHLDDYLLLKGAKIG